MRAYQMQQVLRVPPTHGSQPLRWHGARPAPATGRARRGNLISVTPSTFPPPLSQLPQPLRTWPVRVALLLVR